MFLPKARNTDIVVQNAGAEVLIYDTRANKAFCLNETSTTVYEACDGGTTFEQLRGRTGFTDELILVALDQLQNDDLIESEKITFDGGLSRREVVRRIGFASLVALPLISYIVAPNAVNAQSAGGGLAAPGAACVGDPVCSSGKCSINKNTCCNQLPGAINDGAPCSADSHCCLVSGVCRSGSCCRAPGFGAGNSGSGVPSLCCSGICNDVSSLCVCQ